MGSRDLGKMVTEKVSFVEWLGKGSASFEITATLLFHDWYSLAQTLNVSTSHTSGLTQWWLSC